MPMKSINILLLLCNIVICTGTAYSGWTYEYTKTDLANQTTAELRLLRNEVYARHGYIFTSKDLREYFQKQVWYKPNPNANITDLNIFEREYLENILEKEKGALKVYPFWRIERPVEYHYPPEAYHVGWHNIVLADDYNNVEIFSYDPEAKTICRFGKQGFVSWISNGIYLGGAEKWFSVANDRTKHTHSFFSSSQSDGILHLNGKKCRGESPIKIETLNGVYSHISASVDMYDRPQLAFYDEGNADLKYAILSGKPWEEKKWKIRTIDAAGDVGMFNSIKNDAYGRAHILYYDATRHEIRYALIDGAVIKTEDVVRQEIAGAALSMALDSDGIPHVSYYGSKGLRYANRAGGKWREYAVDQASASGYYNSIAVTRNSLVYIAYYDGKCNCLKFATGKSGEWKIEQVGKVGSAGKYVALTLDKKDIPHIAYYDGSINNLRYATLISSETDGDSPVSKTSSQKDGGFALMVPFDDITPPVSKMTFNGSAYSRVDEAQFISSSTYIELSSSDMYEKCGDISGGAALYYAINSNLSECVEQDYLASLKNAEYFQKMDLDDITPAISTSIYCGYYNSVFVLPEGSHALSYLAVDHVGNYELENTTRVYVDGTPPQSKITSKGGSFKDGVFRVRAGTGIELTASDSASSTVGSGVSAINFLVDEEPFFGEIEGWSGFNVYKSPLELTPGEHIIYLMAVDNVENAEDPQRIKVYVY